MAKLTPIDHDPFGEDFSNVEATATPGAGVEFRAPKPKKAAPTLTPVDEDPFADDAIGDEVLSQFGFGTAFDPGKVPGVVDLNEVMTQPAPVQLTRQEVASRYLGARRRGEVPAGESLEPEGMLRRLQQGTADPEAIADQYTQQLRPTGPISPRGDLGDTAMRWGESLPNIAANFIEFLGTVGADGSQGREGYLDAELVDWLRQPLKDMDAAQFGQRDNDLTSALQAITLSDQSVFDEKPSLGSRAWDVASAAPGVVADSAPHMAGIMMAPQVMLMSMVEDAATERAINDGRTVATQADKLAVLPAQLANLGLERFATKSLAKPIVPGVGSAAARIGTQAVIQPGTEVIEEIADLESRHLGTATPSTAPQRQEATLGAVLGGAPLTGVQAGQELITAMMGGPDIDTVPSDILRATVLSPDTTQEVRLAAAMQLMQRGESVEVPEQAPVAEAPPMPLPKTDALDLRRTVADLAQVLAGGTEPGVQGVPQPVVETPTQENVRGQAESQEGTGEEAGQAVQAGPAGDAGQAPAVQQGPVTEDPLAPRIPAAPALPPDVTREQLIAEYRAAPSPGEKSAVAARIAAFDAQEQERATATTSDQAGRASAVVDAPDGGAPAASLAEPLTSAGLPAGAPAAASGPVTVLDDYFEQRVPGFTRGTVDVEVRDTGDGASPAGQLKRIYKSVFGLDTVVFRANDPQLNQYNGMARVPGAPNTVFINENGDDSFAVVLSHEFGHELRAQRPDLYDGLVDKLRNNAKLTQYLSDSLYPRMTPEQQSVMTTDMAREELISDTWQRLLTDKDFVAELAAEEPTLFNQLKDAVIAFLDRTLGRLRDVGADGTKYYRDVVAMRKAFKETATTFARDRAAGITTPEQAAARDQATAPAAAQEQATPQAPAAPGTEPVASRAKTPAQLLRNLTPQEQAKVTDKVAQKIIAQLQSLPDPKEMAAVAYAGKAKRGWYRKSADAISAVFGPDAPRFAGLLAALSPQVSVETNLRNALNVWQAWDKAGRPQDREQIIDIMAANVEGSGSRSSVLGAWINNSVRALTGLDPSKIMLSGPKVDSFMRNLLGDVMEVTNDTWMANYAAVKQTIFSGGMLKSGKDPGKGTGYLAMNALTRQAAQQLTKLTGETWTPAEVQETVWSWGRVLSNMAGSAEEIRDEVDLVNDRAITDELIASTPDFGTLFTDPEYAAILEEAGYGEQLEDLRNDALRGAAREAREEPADGGKTGPFAPEAQARFERAAAKRLKQSRIGDDAKPRAAEEVDDFIPFSRRKKVATPGGPATVNIGLEIPTGGKLKHQAVRKALTDTGVKIKRAAVIESDSEPTLVAEIDRALTADEAYALSELLQQEAIAIRYNDGNGALFGPQAEKWGEYNPEFFITYSGRRASEIEKVEKAGKDFDAKDAMKGWSAKPVQPDAVSAIGYHYSNTPGLSTLNPGMAGSANAGRERRRFGMGTFGARGGNAARLGFYVREPGKPIPKPEDVVAGRNLYRVNLANLYDTNEDPRGIVADARGNADLMEEEISDAGFDGFLAPPMAGIDVPTAVVFDIGKGVLIPVEAVDVPGPMASRRNPQVDTPAFKRWFGDSKVVDENGDPLVVYRGEHGEGAAPGRLQSRRGALSFGDEATATFYANNPNDLRDDDWAREPRVHPVYLSIQNPVPLKHDPFLDFRLLADVIGEAATRKFALENESYVISGGGFFDEKVAEAGLEPNITSLEQLLDARPDMLFDFDIEAFRIFDDPAMVAAFKAAGYDGAIHEGFGENSGEVEYRTFDESQAKHATANAGTFDRANPSIVASRRQQPFYSALHRAIQEGKGAPKKADATAWKQWLDGAQRRGEIKQSERDWLGVDAWLDERGTTTRLELEGFVAANQVTINSVALAGLSDAERSNIPENWTFEHDPGEDEDRQIVLLDENNDPVGYGASEEEAAYDAGLNLGGPADSSIGPAKFSSYQLPGGENYRELLLTLPDRVETSTRFQVIGAFPRDDLATREEAEQHIAQVTEMMSRFDNTRAQLEKFPLSIHEYVEKGKGNNFKSTHFDQLNILAHVRYNERTDADGKRVLFIEEIQSDWHQAGRKHGYNVDTGWMAAVAERRGDNWEIKRADGSLVRVLPARHYATAEDALAYANSLPATERSGAAVPDAPFKATDEWAMLTFKRMVVHAAENGFDRIAWTTGEQQAARYDLSKQVDMVRWTSQHDDTYMIEVVKRGGGRLEQVHAGAKKSELPDIVGKELADKILAEAAEGVLSSDFEGVDLKVGGEGMKAFYDKILPSAVNKWAKRFGGRVSQARVAGGDTVFTYVGPSYSLNKVEDAYKKANASGPDSKVSPLTGERLSYAFNRVAVAQAIRPILADMRGGMPLKAAIEKNGGDVSELYVEEIFGGKLIENGPAGVAVHALDMTPSMRDAALQGLPMFSRKTPAMAQQQRATQLGALAQAGFPQGSPTQVPPGRFVPLKTAVDMARVKLQDKLLPVLRAQDRTGAKTARGISSITLDDAMNAYRMENLMHGKVKDRQDAANIKFILPMQAQLKRLGLSADQLQDYLYARHAKERNAAVAKINKAMPDGGSGLLNQEADDILAGRAPGPYSGKVLDNATIQKLANVAQKVDAMRDLTIDNMVEAGQITPKLAAVLRAKYKNYVPLRGKESDEIWGPSGMGSGKGLSNKKSPLKRALGRGKGNHPDNILGEVVGDLQRSIIAAEKKKPAQALLKFALANPMPELFTVEPVDLEWKFSEATGEAYLGVRSSAEDAERSILVNHNGNQVRIRFEDPDLRDAVMNMGIEDMSGFVKIAGAINRWRSAVLTRFNPGFAPVNVIRDAMFGMTGLATEKGAGVAMRAGLDYVPALAALWRDSKTQSGNASVPNAQKSMDDWAREYAESGAKTGLTQVDDVKDLQRRLQIATTTLMQLAAEGRPIRLAAESIIRAGKPILETVERINDATENALRLSAYIAQRKDGQSIDKAAEYAKNLTINFNRKGQWGSVLNAIYLFFNAAIQGTHAVQRVLRRPGTQAFVAGLASLQYVMALSMMGDDDDDGITAWDKVPDYVKRTSIVFPLGGLTGDERDYFALPMPYGFNVFPYMGGRLAQHQTLGKRPTDPSVIADMAKSMTEAFSPVPVAEGYAGMFGDTLGFAMSLAANRDDLGAPIAKEDPYAKSTPPKALEGLPSTARPYHVAAQLLAKLGGADLEERVPPIGFLDVAPEQLEEVVGFITGGLGNIGNQGFRWYEQLQAKNLERGTEIVTAFPIAKRFIGTANEARAVADRYYGERAELDRKHQVVQDRLRRGDDLYEVADEAAKDPTMQGLTPAVYKSSGAKGGAKGDFKRSESGGVQIDAEEGSATAAMKSSEKAIKTLNATIRGLRDDDITNAQVLSLLQDVAEEDFYDQLGLPKQFDLDAKAPTRVRNRAIRLVQEVRQDVMQGTLKTIKEVRGGQ